MTNLVAEHIAQALRDRTNRTTNRTISKGEMGAIRGAINKLVGSDVNRHLVVSYIFTGKADPAFKMGSMPACNWEVLLEWIDFYKDSTYGWLVSSDFERECLLLMRDALVLEGQQDMLQEAFDLGGELKKIVPDDKKPKLIDRPDFKF